MRQALGIAPGLAGQVFAGGEQLRGAEQQANIGPHERPDRGAAWHASRRRLRRGGIDQNAINQYIDLLKMSQMRPIPHIVGKSPYQENLAALETASKFMPAGGV